jgi:hypothetical protein
MIMPKAKPTVAITPTVHAKMQAAVDYLNAHLFDGELPDAFLVFQRRAHSGGHFAPDRYVHRNSKDTHQHEIAGDRGGVEEVALRLARHPIIHQAGPAWQIKHLDETFSSSGNSSSGNIPQALESGEDSGVMTTLAAVVRPEACRTDSLAGVSIEEEPAALVAPPPIPLLSRSVIP